jgi:glycosyltransferase involved in cell wall biosynthesis
MRMHQERGLRGRMVQLPLFHPEPHGTPTPEQPINGERPFFLFVGRLEKIKGVQTLIPVFRRLENIDLVIAGSGTYEAELRSMADGAGNILFVGRMEHGRLQALYRAALATIVPSLCYETFGVVVAESFSVGTPVIVYAQSSLEEIVRLYGGGLMYRTDDELHGAIKCMWTDSMLRERLGCEGRAAYEAEFAEAPFLRHYLAVVYELLARKRAGKPVEQPDVTADLPLLAGRPVFLAQNA